MSDTATIDESTEPAPSAATDAGTDAGADEHASSDEYEYAATVVPVAWLLAASTHAQTALSDAGFEVVDAAEGANFAVLSTRTARHRLAGLIATAREADLMVVALTHPGGEQLAVEAVRLGAVTAVAEGDGDALNRLATDPEQLNADDEDPESSGLVDAYDARVVKGGASQAVVPVTSPISGLPSEAALAARITLGDEQSLRIVSFRVANLAQACSRLSPDAALLLARRLAVGFRTVCEPHGSLYDLGEGTYVLMAPGIDIATTEQIARRMATITEAYTPDPTSPLLVAVGHAGPECSNDPHTLRELATRAEATAALEDVSTVLGAGELVGSLATATELEVTLRLIELVGKGAAIADRETIATAAAAIAERLGFEYADRVQVRFVAHVADIGRIRAGNEPDDENWREHPAAGASFLAVTAGGAIAKAVRHTHENWDGSGFPDGIGGQDIPVAARICAVAEAFVSAGCDVEAITSGSATTFDPAVVEAAVDLIQEGAL